MTLLQTKGSPGNPHTKENPTSPDQGKSHTKENPVSPDQGKFHIPTRREVPYPQTKESPGNPHTNESPGNPHTKENPVSRIPRPRKVQEIPRPRKVVYRQIRCGNFPFFRRCDVVGCRRPYRTHPSSPGGLLHSDTRRRLGTSVNQTRTWRQHFTSIWTSL